MMLLFCTIFLKKINNQKKKKYLCKKIKHEKRHYNHRCSDPVIPQQYLGTADITISPLED